MTAPAITAARGRVTLHLGDCREVLKALPPASVNCIVTSPPYFGLRDYGCDGQIGLEQTPDAFVAELVGVFREARRVLRDDVTLWLNLGDSYAGGGTMGRNDAGRDIGGRGGNKEGSGNPGAQGARPKVADLKSKDLIGIPWRVAFALQADGWFLRQDIIWHKPNPMPESVRDRCTKAHEYLFLLSKSQRYFFDADAISEPGSMRDPCSRPSHKHIAVAAVDPKRRTAANLHAIGPAETRNRRSVWTVATRSYDGAHFATFPPDLIEPCVLAGCPKGGVVLDPFGGAGTTGLVAARHARDAILIELNPDYRDLAVARINSEWREPPARPAAPPIVDGLFGLTAGAAQ